MGKLIVIEGLDGSGKETQAAILTEALKKMGLKVRKVSFPDYASESSALVKMYLSGEFGVNPDDVNAYAASSFYAVDRYASFKRNWEKDFQAGVIISDRYTTSNAIHQCSKLDRSQWDDYLKWLFDYEYQLLRIPEPSAVIYLHVDLPVSQQLMQNRYKGQNKQDIHERDMEYLERCQQTAAYCLERLGWKFIECTENGKMRSIDDIHMEIMSLVKRTLRLTNQVTTN